MHSKKLNLLSYLIASATLISGIIGNKTHAQTTEYWNSSEGELQIKSEGGNSYFGVFNGNQLLGTRSKQGDFLGHWINKKQDTPRCKYKIKDSYYWGIVNLKFNSNKFSGKFGVCDFPPGAPWNGTLKMTGSGNSGLDLSGFFQPAYTRTFITSFGPMTFQKTSGTYDRGKYGNGYGSIKITNTFWRPSTRREQEVHGRFSNNEGRQGQFILNFESECVFRGEYWYDQDRTKKRHPWLGICYSGRSRPSGGWSCKADTASCNAQAAGLLVEEYCIKNPKKLGCPFKFTR